MIPTPEIRVYGEAGDVFAAPNLIFHYVASHWYRPPEPFVAALNVAQDPTSPGYLEALRALGVEWRDNPPLIEDPVSFRFVRLEDGEVVKVPS